MKYWSLLFGLISVLAIAMFLYAPIDDDWWLPSYRATNAEALATLEGLDQRLDQAAEVVTSWADDPSAAVDAETRDTNLEFVDELWAWLERQQAKLDRIAQEHYLSRRTRAIESQAAEAVGSVGSVRSALASGSAPALNDAAEQAANDLSILDQSAEQALAAVLEPSGSLRSPLSSAAVQVDHLYILILIVVGLVFIGVMFALVYAGWKFAADPNRRAQYTHGSQRVEVVWTVIPAAILIFIALYQLGAWADIKFQNTWPDVDPAAQVTARQFQWKIRYPGPDGELNTEDDLHTVNDLHLVQDNPTVIYLKSEDVLHSFFLPQLRIKQDAVPGLTIPVFFDVDKPGHYELLCAELCGWGHYKMRANVVVHETPSEFNEWMDQALREQNRSQPPSAEPTATAEATGSAEGTDTTASAEGPRVE